MDYGVFSKLYESLVEPVLFYGAGIWGLCEQKKINTVQNKACRYFLGLGKNAANIASQGDMGWTSCNMKQKIESCRLYFKIQCTDDNRLVKKVFRWSSTHGKSWESRFKNFLSKNDLQDLLIIIIIINSLFKEDDILSKYNYLSNIWSSATKQTNNMDRFVQYIHAMRI